MRLRFILLTIIAVMTLPSSALDVVNTAGGLRDAVTDLEVTALKVSGTMDANDFYFIADNLHNLQTIDLADVTVVACHTAVQHYLTSDFDADELPTGAFASMNLTSVRLPSGLKSIGFGALADCERLTSIDLPQTLETIADYAFARCLSLRAVTIPAGVREVGRGAFMRCTALEVFSVATGGRLTRLSDEALMDCPLLTAVNLGNAIKSVGASALTGTGVQQLDLTASVALEEIGDWALTLTPVTTVTLPASLRSLGTGALLYADRLTGITLGDRLTDISDYTFAGTSLHGTLNFDKLKTLGDFALYNVQTLADVHFPATTKRLGTRSMAGMTGLAALSCDATTPPALGDEVWAGVRQSKVPLTVPQSSMEQYRSSAQWQLFLYPSQWLRGDVNNDGSVNISDINAVVNIILGYNADAGTMQRADVNGDGSVNISDLNEIINIILTPSNKVIATVDTDDQLHLPDVVVTPDEEVSMALELDHAAAYNALQCDITLPQGLTLVSGNGPEGFVVEYCAFDDGTTRIVLYSPDGSSFEGDNPVLALTLRAEASLPEDSWILLSGAMIADSSDGWHTADCTAHVSVSSVDDLAGIGSRVWTEYHTLCIESRKPATAMLTNISGISRQLSLTEGVNRIDLEPGIYVVVIDGRSHKIAIQ